MSFSPFARFRNFTLDNLKSLLEIYPEAFDTMNWDEVGNIIESSHKGYKKTSYQQACQFGLEDKSDKQYRIQNYLYNFDDSYLRKHIEFWACTYYAPNPYVNSDDPSIIIFCEIGKAVLNSPNYSIDYFDFFEKNIGGKSDDILLNILREYCAPLKYKKENDKTYIYTSHEDVDALEEKISFIENEFQIVDPKSRKLFFERYSFSNFCKYYDLKQKDETDDSNYNETNVTLKGYNKIYYGIPGCGKSYYIENTVLDGVDKKNNVFRTTFYLDYSNSDFIGQIYPVVDGDKVKYEPIPGPFTKALERALTNKDEMIYLVIEEINRGNAAAIFGDTFQLLDRLKENKNGRVIGDSEYPISNSFIEDYLRKQDVEFIPGNIYIPHNLTLLATMNTSDQNVFPLDTAFKRRWNREKVTSDWGEENKIKGLYIPYTSVTWETFVKTINKEMIDKSAKEDAPISEDKQMGAYFADKSMLSKNPNDKDGDKIDSFANNVLDYLFNDVTKFNHKILFEEQILTTDKIYERIDMYKKAVLKESNNVGAEQVESKNIFSEIFTKDISTELVGNAKKVDDNND